MPFVSEAQRRKFAELVKDGKMSKEVFNEWNKETPQHIPERKSEPVKGLTKVRKIKRI